MNSNQTDRGQTPLDFVVGFSIFILGVMFVFMMAPNLISPFSEGQTANPLLADRVADDLSESRLVESPSSAEVDQEEADAFFDKSTDVHSYLGIHGHTQINISIISTSTDEIYNDYTVGPNSPRETGRVTVTQRIVLIDGNSHWLYVRVW